MTELEQIKANLLKKPVARPSVENIPRKNFLSSGSSMLDLAATGIIGCCYAKGHCYLFVGDSDSGKTVLGLTALAEACLNKQFDDYTLIHDNSEKKPVMSLLHFFGKRTASRVKSLSSSSLEEFYFMLDDETKKGPCIIVEDSMDALMPKADMKHFTTMKSQVKKGEEGAGSYGTAKAKMNSSHMRLASNFMQRHGGSILLIMGQTRDKINTTFWDPEKKTRGGGKALKFYATLEIWSSVRKELTKKLTGYSDKKRQLGILSQIQVKKNHITGRKRMIEVPIYHSTGVDDLGSLVDFLVEEGHWKTSGKDDKGKITASEFGIEAYHDKLITRLDEEDKHEEVKKIASEVWQSIEEQLKVQRKRRYV